LNGDGEFVSYVKEQNAMIVTGLSWHNAGDVQGEKGFT
jgi:hypothetical protein